MNGLHRRMWQVFTGELPPEARTGDSQSHRILFWERLTSPTPLAPVGQAVPQLPLWKGLCEHRCVQKIVHPTHTYLASTSLPSN